MFQDFVRYQFTLAENIGLGWVPALDDRPRIERAATAGGADAVVERLPRGYETMLGGYFEAGQELSVGQWQKVATSRVFMGRKRYKGAVSAYSSHRDRRIQAIAIGSSRAS